MKKRINIPVIVMTVLFIITTAITFLEKRKIDSLQSDLSDLVEKNSQLTKQIAELTSEKENAIRKLSEISEQSNSYQRSLNLIDNSTAASTSTIGLSRGIAIVVYKPSSCDYFILENSSGYIVAEWMGGNDPDRGDKVTGDFNSFGTKEFYNQTRDSESRLWIDDYMMSKEDALEKIQEQCH